MRISFHGAAGGVTGSCLLVEWRDRRLLVDCGLFQGTRAIEEENDRPFGFDPAGIDHLLLTHAHLDHCGRIPLLVKRGFGGEIIATGATRDLARLVMLDAARLHEEEAQVRARRAARRGRRPAPPAPLYTTLDALDAIERFGRRAHYGRPLAVAPGIRATFVEAGHILGSACILLALEDGRRRLRLLCSGDLGSPGRPILRDPAVPPRADVVVMESTYGDRPHKPLAPSVAELYQAIQDTFARGGNVIIPTFALERAQEVLFFLRAGVARGRLPAAMQVFLDSPMAISATRIYARHRACMDGETARLFARGRDPFTLPGLHYTRETAESMAINRIAGGAVILAGSGMCTGGRVLHHLRRHLWREDSSVIFVGYAARGTLARRIVDGARRVTLFGERIPVRARIHTIGGFSAHAGCRELAAWHRHTGAGLTYLVHGEPAAMADLAGRLNCRRIRRPRLHQAYRL